MYYGAKSGLSLIALSQSLKPRFLSLCETAGRVSHISKRACFFSLVAKLLVKQKRLVEILARLLSLSVTVVDHADVSQR